MANQDKVEITEEQKNRIFFADNFALVASKNVLRLMIFK